MRAFHVTSSQNRSSIHDHGLDWNLMGEAPGIAGSRTAEVHGIHLCIERSEADFFVRMNNTGGALDLWAVEDVEPAELLDDGSGFVYVTSTLPPHRLTLMETDLPRTPPVLEQPSEESTQPVEFTIEDSVVRFSHDYWAASPLWADASDLDEEWLRRGLGLDEALVADLLAWTADMEATQDAVEVDGRLRYVVTGEQEYEQRWALAARALALVARVEEQIAPQRSVDYVPWDRFPGRPLAPGTISVADDRDMDFA